MINVKIIFLVTLLLFLFGCSSLPSATNQATSKIQQPKQASQKNEQRQIRNKLLSQYNEWQGVPYQLGGLSKNGIDCSGFVFLTFQRQFSRSLARTTKQMVKAGIKISKWKLQVGDLVFFKTEGNKRHVGIYLGGDEFMHASTSQGVMISYLSNPYWSSHYWFASRQ